MLLLTLFPYILASNSQGNCSQEIVRAMIENLRTEIKAEFVTNIQVKKEAAVIMLKLESVKKEAEATQ